jgi:hypothetical protein
MSNITIPNHEESLILKKIINLLFSCMQGKYTMFNKEIKETKEKVKLEELKLKIKHME